MIINKNLAGESLQNLLRTKLSLLNYIKEVSVSMGIDINKGRWMNVFKEKKLSHSILPEGFPKLTCSVLDIVDLYINIKKYSTEEIIPIGEETNMVLSFCDYIEENKKRRENLLNKKN